MLIFSSKSLEKPVVTKIFSHLVANSSFCTSAISMELGVDLGEIRWKNTGSGKEDLGWRLERALSTLVFLAFLFFGSSLAVFVVRSILN